MPSTQFRGVLEPDPQGKNGAVVLSVVENDPGISFTVGFGNSGSKYIGPTLIDAGVIGKFVPYQQFFLQALKSYPFSEMGQLGAGYGWNVTLRDRIDLMANWNTTSPGDALRENDIESQTEEYSGKWTHSFLRLRRETIVGDLQAGIRRSDSKILGAELSKDRIRYLVAGGKISRQDSWDGLSIADVHLTKGLGILGASDKAATNTSRERSGGDFTKAEMTMSRLQSLSADWTLQTAITGQIASRSLPSSEEFGYGGMTFGRAYIRCRRFD